MVTPSGGKLWRWNYEYDGKNKTMAFGAYPRVSLADAREKRDEAWSMLCEGQDPNVAKRLKIEANLEAGRQTFERVAREWHENAKAQWATVRATMAGRQQWLVEQQLADVDGDGLSDIITGKRWWAHGPKGDADPAGAPVLYAFLTRRAPDRTVTFEPRLLDDNSGIGTQVSAADVNADGRADFIVGNKRGTFVVLSKNAVQQK